MRLDAGGLTISPEGSAERRWKFAAIRLAQGKYETEPVRVEHGEDPAEALVVDDRRFLAALRQSAPQGAASLAAGVDRELSWRTALGLFAVAAALLVAITVWGVPAIGGWVADNLPVTWEERLGSSVSSALASEEDLCTSPELQEAVESIVARLSKQAPESPYTYRVALADGILNAFALPGGYVIVFDDLLEATDSPEELAGVLAHELQHVEKRHSTRALFRDVFMSALLAAVSGDAQAGATLLNSAVSFGTLAHHRDDEEEADREGMRMLLAAQIDPAGMLQMFAKFAELEEGMPQAFAYVSTHPMSEDRQAYLAELAVAAQSTPEPLLPDADWAKLKGACRAETESPDTADGVTE